METSANNEIENIWGYAKRLRFVREVIHDSFAKSNQVTVLDIGSGNGSQLAIPLAHDVHLQITALDPDETSIGHGRELAAGLGNLNFVCDSVEALPTERRFDVVILSEVLEHLDHPEIVLRRAKALLADSGVMIVTVPNGYGEFEIDSAIFRGLHLQKVVDRFARKSEEIGATDNCESGHVQFFTRARLRQLFKEVQLVVMKEAAGSFLAGPVAGHFIARSQRLVQWNARVTDHLPFVLASGWYFALQPHKSSDQVESQK